MKKVFLTLFAAAFAVSFSIAQKVGTADVTQTGTNNDANVKQVTSGGKANAFVNQSVGNATANIEQIQNASAGGDLDATVNQQGNNLADVYQRDRNLDVVVNQINTGGAAGALNEAYVSQGENAGGVVGADAFVRQEGEGNFVDVDQDRINAPFSHRADLDQIGNDNSIALQQDGSAPGDGAEATVRQEGNGNTFEGLDGGDQAFQGSSSFIDAGTFGSNNLIQIEQGADNTATITQGNSGTLSDGNTAIVDQTGGSFNTATITQNQ